MSHTTIGPKGTVFMHNGDFSGNIEIKDHRLYIETNIEDLVYIVGKYIKDKEIERIETMPEQDFIKQLMRF